MEFFCVSRYYKCKDGAGINSRDVILVIVDICPNCPTFLVGALTHTTVKKRNL